MKSDNVVNLLKLLEPTKKITEKPIEQYISPEEFKNFGKFEQQILFRFGEMLGMVQNGDEIKDFGTFKRIIAKIMESKENPEKQYILGLLSPKTIEQAFYPSPFPIPIYTYKQEYSFTLAANNKGCFVIQFVSPLLPLKVDDFVGTKYDVNNLITVPYADYLDTFVTDVFVCNDNSLNGVNVLPSSTSTERSVISKRTDSAVTDTLFTAVILVGASISIKYVGSENKKSGMIGASYDLSDKNFSQFDFTATNFDNIIRGNNYTQGNLEEPLTALFLPPDNSFCEFRKPGDDFILNKTASFSHRINIFGRGLDVSNQSIDGKLGDSFIVTVDKVYACIPKVENLEVLKTQVSNVDANISRKFLTDNKLGVYTGEIEPIVNTIKDYPFDISKVKTLDEMKIDKIRIRLGLK